MARGVRIAKMASATPTEVQDLLLSHTYESSQLITPKQLDRITIDDQQSVRISYIKIIINVCMVTLPVSIIKGCRVYTSLGII